MKCILTDWNTSNDADNLGAMEVVCDEDGEPIELVGELSRELLAAITEAHRYLGDNSLAECITFSEEGLTYAALPWEKDGCDFTPYYAHVKVYKGGSVTLELHDKHNWDALVEARIEVAHG